MKSCLFRYITTILHLQPSELRGHSAEWASWCIYHILCGLGYQVDTINWKDKDISINKVYDVVWDAIDLRQLKPAIGRDTIKIIHLSGADNVWRNKQGLSRVKDVNRKRGCNLTYTRLIPNPEVVYNNIELADYVTLNGNDWTLNTYPERYRDKIHLVNVSAALL